MGLHSMDTSALNQALAKAIAYKVAGKDKEAKEWADKLIKLMEKEGLL